MLKTHKKRSIIVLNSTCALKLLSTGPLHKKKEKRSFDELWDQRGSALGDIVFEHHRVHEKVINYVFVFSVFWWCGCQGRRFNSSTTETSVHTQRRRRGMHTQNLWVQLHVSLSEVKCSKSINVQYLMCLYVLVQTREAEWWINFVSGHREGWRDGEEGERKKIGLHEDRNVQKR